MQVLVVGAAGRTGRAVVAQAAAAGHAVTAFVRDATKYTAPPGVRVVAGDATDRAAMDAAVRGQDAVLDAVGGKTPYKATTLEADTAGAIVAAMRRHGARRLVVTSTLGVGESTANATAVVRLLVATFLRGADKDKTAMERAVASSDLDWVILRPAVLTDAPAIGRIRVFDPASGEKAHTITRADLAAFMVAQLGDDIHLRRAVTVANR